jgi:hypothetical protein
MKTIIILIYFVFVIAVSLIITQLLFTYFPIKETYQGYIFLFVVLDMFLLSFPLTKKIFYY